MVNACAKQCEPNRAGELSSNVTGEPSLVRLENRIRHAYDNTHVCVCVYRFACDAYIHYPSFIVRIKIIK